MNEQAGRCYEPGWETSLGAERYHVMQQSPKMGGWATVTLTLDCWNTPRKPAPPTGQTPSLVTPPPDRNLLCHHH